MTTTYQDFYPAVSGSATVGEKAAFCPRFAGRVISARLHVGTIGTGTLSFDVRINGVSVFSSTPTLSAGNSSSSTFNADASVDDFAANDRISIHVVSAAGTPPQNLSFQIKMEWDSADTYVAQSANRIFAGPTTGADAVPAFRALVPADLPAAIDAAKIADGSVSNTEFQYLNGVSSAIQTQLDTKAAVTGVISKQATTPGSQQTSANVNIDGTAIIGTLVDTATLKVGSGATLSKILSATATLDFASGPDVQTMTVTGAAVGDTVALGVPHGSVPSDGAFFGWVSATDTVSIRYTGTGDPSSGTFRATVFKF